MNTLSYTIHCPKCGTSLEVHQCVDTHQPMEPKKGDFSICFTCQSTLRFEGEGVVRVATPEDMIELNDADPEVFDMLIKAQKVVRDFKYSKEMQKNEK